MITETVREFTATANDDLPQKPRVITIKELQFIRDMVNSEFDEVEEALLNNCLTKNQKITGIYDGIVDALYYIGDFCVRHGLNVDEVFGVVHAANMRKFVDGKVIKNERGKVLKPEGWYGPEEEMEKVIARHIEQGSWS